MDGQLAAAKGQHVSWEAISSNSAVGLKFWEARRKTILPFLLNFWHFLPYNYPQK